MGCCCKKKKQEESILETEQDTDEIIDSNLNETQLSEIKAKIKIELDNFEIIKLIGEGTYGKVLLVRLKSNQNLYAMKILNKMLLKLKKQEIHTKNERDIMVKISSPFIVNIKFAFQDDKNLYLVSEFMQGGELFFHLRKNRYFSEDLVKFYAMELVLAISHIHRKNAVYRDLKPENILLDKDGHIKLTDFGLSKIIKANDKAYTICGTIKYIAPEILMNRGYKKEVDWWSLGCVLFEMLEGKAPFGMPVGELDMSFFQRKVMFFHTKSQATKSFIRELLVFDPTKRLGYGTSGINLIKKHKFFEGVDWDKALKKEYKAPFIPQLNDDLDLKYFDKDFTQKSIDAKKFQNKKNSDNNNNEKESKVVDINYPNFSFIDNEVGEDLLKNTDNENE